MPRVSLPAASSPQPSVQGPGKPLGPVELGLTPPSEVRAVREISPVPTVSFLLRLMELQHQNLSGAGIKIKASICHPQANIVCSPALGI